jgi:hypothetical protein
MRENHLVNFVLKPAMIELLRKVLNYFRRLSWFLRFSSLLLKRRLFWSGILIFVISPLISLCAVDRKVLATRGRIPEFHYTLS